MAQPLIGLMTNENPSLLVGMLGILKAGAAFVPIRSDYPDSRVDWMLHDCGIRILVTERAHQARAEAIAARNPALQHVVYLDALPAAPSEPLPDPDPESHPLAYVIYTSGSTGQPKGVPLTHANVVPLLLWAGDYFALGSHTRVLQNLSYAFDFGVFELLTTLLFGGELFFFEGDKLADLPGYVEFLTAQQINTLHTTPALFRALIALGRPLPSLRLVHLGGEKLTFKLVQDAAPLLPPHHTFYNGYGPTETAINCAIFAATPDALPDLAGRDSLPIGKPTANHRLYILNSALEPVPIGVAGELCVGGPSLSPGYLNRPALAAEKFIPDPFSRVPGSRLYRTGDLVRFLPSGNIEFLGRIDHQVKVRGYRIELGEIEAALHQYPAVREAIVLAREEESGNHTLVAYLVPQPGATPHPDALRPFLAATLPPYMVPSAFVPLPSLPRTPNGKIDRRALPAPDRAALALDLLAPRTPTEARIAAIWAEVLCLEQVGVEDDFFALGGHSLLATQALARLREALGRDISLPTFFRHATVARLAAWLAEQETQPESAYPPIRPAPRDGLLPLTFPQEQVWFLNELSPGGIAYNFSTTIRFKGHLDPDLLAHVFSEIVRRHESLRTTFHAQDGTPAQRIHPPFPITVPVTDLRALPLTERETEAERLVAVAFQHQFDVTQLPLVRWNLLHLADDDWMLVHVDHHFVHDGWSFAVLLREVQTLYNAFARGEPSPLPDLTIHLADFAVWQRGWIQGEWLAGEIAYWRQRLAGAPATLDLPTDFPRPKQLSYRGAAPRVQIPAELARALRAFARREGITLFMALLAGFQVLLHRYTGQTDLVLGSGVANRRLRESESLLGMIVNTVLLRTDLSGNPTIRDLFDRVRDATLDTYAHQDVPIEKLVEALRPDRDLSRNPLFQVMFSFHDSPVPDLELQGATGRVLERNNGSAKVDLSVIVVPRAEQRAGQPLREEDEAITVMWEYSSDLFRPATIAHMVEQYHTLLSALATAPATARLSDLSLLSEQERCRLLTEWGQNRRPYPREQTLSERFLAQVAATPDALALDDGRERWSYVELARRATHLAHHLRTLGVGLESHVGLCLPRSADLIVAMLATLLAGGAYVPLDPTYPVERVAFLLEDAAISHLLTEPDYQPPARYQGHTLALAPLWAELLAQPTPDLPPLPLTPDALACVLYTSGSTGQPKGVGVTQRGVMRLVCNTDYLQIVPTDRVAHISSPLFDAATFEVWGALLNGASLHPLLREMVLVPSELAAAVKERGLTVLFATTALFNQLAAQVPDLFRTLRAALFGGEAAEPRWVREMLVHAPNTRFINLYGPTENATATTSYAPRELPAEVATVSIGQPIANTTVYLLDPTLQLVPVGVPGELYTGGEGLARGYANRPARTAETFIPDPFGSEPGGRLYRTGDLARWLPDGTLEFLGRRDTQVKIRGYRIEPGEIEATLSRHPTVRETIVIARDTVAGGKQLVAYVAPHPDTSVSAIELRTFLHERLPDYLVPTHLVPLDALPLTPNGKVDTRALPAPDHQPNAAAFTAPATDMERHLAAIWSEVLGIVSIGRESHFFALGGHSLLATQVLSRIRATLGCDLPLRALFEAPTLAALAEQVAQAPTLAPPSTPTPTTPESLLDHLDALSDADLDALLNALSDQGD